MGFKDEVTWPSCGTDTTTPGSAQEDHDGHDAVDDCDAHVQSTAYSVQTTVSDLSLQDMGVACEPVSKTVLLAEVQGTERPEPR